MWGRTDGGALVGGVLSCLLFGVFDLAAGGCNHHIEDGFPVLVQFSANRRGILGIGQELKSERRADRLHTMLGDQIKDRCKRGRIQIGDRTITGSCGRWVGEPRDVIGDG